MAVSKILQAMRGGRVVEALFKGLVVFDAAEDAHAIGTESVYRGADVFDAQLLDEEVGGEIAADGDHEFAQLMERASLTFDFVEVEFGIVRGIEFVDGAVDDGMEFVADGQRVVEMEFAFACLSKEFDHDGQSS